MEKNILTSLEIRSLRRSIENINQYHRSNLSVLEKIALWATKKIGSVGFFIAVVIWSVAWILWNSIGPKELRFDPFPAFELWLFIANIIQLTLLPLLMVGQNLLSRHAEERAEADFKLNQISEKEVSAVLGRLDEILSKINKFDSKIDG